MGNDGDAVVPNGPETGGSGRPLGLRSSARPGSWRDCWSGLKCVVCGLIRGSDPKDSGEGSMVAGGSGRLTA